MQLQAKSTVNKSTESAMQALGEALQARMIALAERANLNAVDSLRVTCKAEDIHISIDNKGL